MGVPERMTLLPRVRLKLKLARFLSGVRLWTTFDRVEGDLMEESFSDGGIGIVMSDCDQEDEESAPLDVPLELSLLSGVNGGVYIQSRRDDVRGWLPRRRGLGQRATAEDGAPGNDIVESLCNL